MHLSRVQIKNFRNFANLEVSLTSNIVLIGENRVGKSNFVFALRLILDSALPDSARQLKFTDIWDGCDLATWPEVQVHLDFADFDSDVNLITQLTEYRLAADYTTARLSYVYRKKANASSDKVSEADYEFKIFGGENETRAVKSETRKRIALDFLPALRDAETELGAWRLSPLRPLLEDAISKVTRDELAGVANDVTTATDRLRQLKPVSDLEDDLRGKIADLAGTSQDLNARLAFAPTDPVRLFRSIGLFIDDGKRAISDASLGSANLALLTLKLAEFEWRRQKNERNYSIVCVEEPEAHLHPHLQRQLFAKLFAENAALPRSFLLTTHSPNVASVAPLNAIVLLRSNIAKGTAAYSLANLNLSDGDREDIERYLNAYRADLFFSRAVLFVEGDAEVELLPIFAKSCGIDFDSLGISVCPVNGVHFGAYVKLATALKLPFAVITDWDPLDETKPPLGKKRAIDLINDIRQTRHEESLTEAQLATMEDDAALRAMSHEHGIFLNSSTLELEIARSPELLLPLIGLLEAEQYGSVRANRLTEWANKPDTVDANQLMAMIAEVGKGRLAARYAKAAVGMIPPSYISNAINHVANACKTTE